MLKKFYNILGTSITFSLPKDTPNLGQERKEKKSGIKKFEGKAFLETFVVCRSFVIPISQSPPGKKYLQGKPRSSHCPEVLTFVAGG